MAAEPSANGDTTSKPQMVTIHILCPSLPAPNRFTVKNVSLSSTVAQLRSRITEVVPTHPAPNAQRLIYRGKALRANDALLKDILIPFDGWQHTIHLVIPVTSTGTGSSSRPLASAPGVVPSQNQPSEETGHRVHAATPTYVSEYQRQMDSLERTLQQSRELYERHMASFHGAFASGASVSADSSQTTPTPGQPTQGNGTSGGSSQAKLADPEAFRMLARQVGQVEYLLSRNRVPSLEILFSMRSQLLEIRDSRNRSNDHGHYPSENDVAQLQGRISAIFAQVDQRVRQLHSLQSQTSNGPTTTNPSQVYLAASPNGYQALVVPQGATVATPPAAAAGTATQAQGPMPNGANPAVPGQNPDIVQNIVRRAILNQQRRQGLAEAHLVRNLRRTWLFVRLYVFCFMVSEAGTWLRILLVSLAGMIACLSETEAPQRLHGMIVVPIQRHLERLAHMGGPADQPAQPAADRNANQATNRAPESLPVQVWQYLRRLERSIMLLFASLIPGIGERQVEARVAAEAQSERARQEQQQEQERQRDQTQAQAEHAPDVETENAGSGTGAPQQPQPTSAA